MNDFPRMSANTPAHDNEPDTIASRFEGLAARVPDNLALITPEVSLTYRDLDGLAGRMAARIEALVPDAARPIGLLMREGALLYAAMIGAAKARKIFIPFETTIGEERLSRLIALSGACHVLADDRNGDAAKRAAGPGTDATVLSLHELRSLGGAMLSRTKSSEDSPACILYTSGSSGEPKGVLLSQWSMVHGADSMGEPLRIQAGDRVASIRSSGYSAGINNVFMTLLRGGCLLPFDIAEQGMFKFSAWLDNEAIARFTITSSFFRAWVASLPEGHRFRTLSALWVGGEALNGSDVVLAARHLAGDWRLVHGYSSTETHPMVTRTLGPSSLPGPGAIAVKTPVKGTRIIIQNENGDEVLPGEAGEIVVKSPFIALGYWNDPDGTARSFGTDEAGNRFYRTGDLGHWRDDGMLEHLGRKGRKIKLRGYAIEPLEIERALLRQAGVRDSVVVVFESGRDEARLVAYVVTTADPTEQLAQSLRDALRSELAAPMVPAQIVFMESLPVTTRGKVDPSALPPPPQPKRSIRIPSDETERALARIWSAILNIAEIGVDDDFYDLGGTSHQSFLVFAQIARQLGHDLSPALMLEAPTIAKQAALLKGGTRGRTSAKVVALRERGSKPALFLIHAKWGDIEYAHDLAKHLKGSRPVYGVRPPPLDGAHHIPQTIEAIAADYIKEIRAIQAKGPYYLGGFSFGGWVAFEMAQQLSRQGEAISFLGIIDTKFPRAPAPGGRPSLGETASFVRMRAGKILAVGPAVARFNALRILPKSMGRLIAPPSYEIRRELYVRISMLASRRYMPKTYAGHVTIFGGKGLSDYHRTNWKPLAHGGITVVEIPAERHEDIVLAPHNATLAAAFDRTLEAGATGSRGGR
jgi:acyl-coenzyme A synthetase/AMP-(fatty) acid ligase/thioesterase domain-containing protein